MLWREMCTIFILMVNVPDNTLLIAQFFSLYSILSTQANDEWCVRVISLARTHTHTSLILAVAVPKTICVNAE